MRELKAIELIPSEQRDLASKVLQLDIKHNETVYALNHVMNNDLFGVVRIEDTEITLWLPLSPTHKMGITFERTWKNDHKRIHAQ